MAFATSSFALSDTAFVVAACGLEPLRVPRFQLVTTDGVVLGGPELGRPDRPAGSVIYPYFHERSGLRFSNRSHLVIEEAKEEVQS